MNKNSTPNKRRDLDMRKLMKSNFEIHIPDETMANDFQLKFVGPIDTPYQGGFWKIHIILPQDYPYKSPSVGFLNRIYHPNVDERSGSVCLDVINQTWSPMFDLVNVMEIFLPQLLRYPNPSDPLNGEAARLMLDSQDKFNAKVRKHVSEHASVDFSFSGEGEGGEQDRKAGSDCGPGASLTTFSAMQTQGSDTPGLRSKHLRECACECTGGGSGKGEWEGEGGNGDLRDREKEGSQGECMSLSACGGGEDEDGFKESDFMDIDENASDVSEMSDL